MRIAIAVIPKHQVSRDIPVSSEIKRDTDSLPPVATVFEHNGCSDKNKYDNNAADSECVEDHGSFPFRLTTRLILLFLMLLPQLTVRYRQACLGNLHRILAVHRSGSFRIDRISQESADP